MAGKTTPENSAGGETPSGSNPNAGERAGPERRASQPAAQPTSLPAPQPGPASEPAPARASLSGGESNLLRKIRRPRETIIHGALLICAFISVATTAGIVAVLLSESLVFFEDVSVTEFLFGTRWAPTLEPRSFGVLPLVGGTFLVAGGAAVIAIPLGLCSAVYLSEYARPRVRGALKPALEVLAGIPTVVYGYFALVAITPALRWALNPVLSSDLAVRILGEREVEVYNAASAALVVGVMILPMVASLSDDALRAVPASLRHAAYALGATQLEVSTRVVAPAALSGVLASFLLAIARAVGETMAVSLAAGSTPKLTLNPLESIQTMTAFMVQISQGEVEVGSVMYRSLFAVGLLLFFITLLMNVAAHRILRRFQEVYE